MGNAGFAGRRLPGPCLSTTLADMRLSSEARIQLEIRAEETLETIVAGREVTAVSAPEVIAALALAIDRGVRLTVVVCEVEHVDSVARELRAVTWPLIYASTAPQAWETDLAKIRFQTGGRGLIVVCGKNARHLDQVRVLIERIDAGLYPALIVDDGMAAMLSARTQARLGELRRLLRRATLRDER